MTNAIHESPVSREVDGAPAGDSSNDQIASVTAPLFSIVIPAHNEGTILEREIHSMQKELHEAGETNYEIIVVSNGCRDNGPQILDVLSKTMPKLIRPLYLDKGDYGFAMRSGMLAAKGKFIVNFDIDYWDITFVKKALALFVYDYDIIIGSKNSMLSNDQRHWVRRLISQCFRLVLHVVFGLKVSDTHGIKAWRCSERLTGLINMCVHNTDVFDTELALRGQLAQMRFMEIPVTCKEKRVSVTSIFSRIPGALSRLVSLYFSLRAAKRRQASYE